MRKFIISMGVFFLVGVAASFAAEFQLNFDDPKALDNFEVINDGTRAEKGEWVVKDGVLNQLTDNVKEGNGPSGQDPAAGGYLLLTVSGSLDWRDYTAQADFVWTDDDWWGIMFYYTDELNYYRFRVEQRDSVEKNQNPRYMLEKFVKGTYTSLADGEIAGARIPDANPGKDNVVEPHTLKVSVRGGNIEAFFDKTSVAKVVDNDLKKGTVAFYMTTNTGWIDNLRVSGETVTAVEPAGKLATVWAAVKAGR